MDTAAIARKSFNKDLASNGQSLVQTADLLMNV
jgi:hypothetical protein